MKMWIKYGNKDLENLLIKEIEQSQDIKYNDKKNA